MNPYDIIGWMLVATGSLILGMLGALFIAALVIAIKRANRDK